MKLRGITKVETIVVVAVGIVILGAGIFVNMYVSTKSDDIRVLSEVKQIRSALDVYRTKNNYYPIATTVVPLNNADYGTQRLCADGFKRGDQQCDVTILSRVPNILNGQGMIYQYQSQNSGADYKLQFSLSTDFSANGLIKGAQCATSSGISSGLCFNQ